ncbi:WD40/YVTN/BNR-like repeat-containing protein [Paraburkholderia aromaticivorans]|uniref:WD40/YVTN/BNR-like repeat-containing protein n=1 Tax=Paraburkholderia aromaticivorans TaxID=2026199 RepID=UPI001455E0EC|nr:YCF48-related protein [Paraburkholderia aromaticivorans]
MTFRSVQYMTASVTALVAALACPPAFAAATGAGPQTASATRFIDPLDAPAETAVSPATRPMTAVASAGQRLVGVGQRGVIVVSDDHGHHWRQVASPVQSDLTAITFPTAAEGWAVGHDGVILHTSNGGTSWTKQLDGRVSNERFVAYYRAAVARGDANVAAWQSYLKQEENNAKAGPSLPYLDVWFDDASHGYAVGSFGSFAVTSDGGKTWQPGLEHIDNPDFLNLNAIRGVGGEVYIAGERGTVFRLDRASGQFKRLQSGYTGSFFGIVGNEKRLFAFGLRGTVYQSTDQGGSWQKADTGTDSTLNGATVLGDGRIVICGSRAMLLVADPVSGVFQRVSADTPMLFAGIAADGADRVALGGSSGMSVEAIGARR